MNVFCRRCRSALIRTKNVLVKTWKRIVFRIKRRFVFVKLFFKQFKFKKDNLDGVQDIRTIVPDRGRVSDEKGFKYSGTTLDLSIIIPMYNVEKYVKDCLNSIFTQTTKYSYEIILVDDGSTDKTMEVVGKFMPDDRIRIIQQQNAGQSVARNRAITESKGKYIMFVDADDLMVGNAIERLMDVAISTSSQIVEGRCELFYHKENLLANITSKKKIKIESSKKNPLFVMSTVGYSIAKVYDRNLWENVRFPENYIFEDVITRFVLRRIANQVAFLDDKVYGYRVRIDSSSRSVSKDKSMDSVYIFPKIFEICRNNGVAMDKTFYILSLWHIGILNYNCLGGEDELIQKMCMQECRKQLSGISSYRTNEIPFALKVLEKAILSGSLNDWKETVVLIKKYSLLKNYSDCN